MLAAQWLDLLWPIFLLLGIEHVRIDPGNTKFTPFDFYDYPITHSLVTSIAWSATFAFVYFLLRRDRRAALVLGVAVFSHWLLDFAAHRADLPLAPHSNRYFGLGLWNHVAATVIVECTMFLIAIIIYLRTTRVDRTGFFAFWAFILLVVFIYAGNITGTPPSSVRALAWFGMSQWIIIPWCYWIDRHRALRSEPRALSS